MTNKSQYEQLLERAYSQLPEKSAEESRFEVPKASGRIEGNKTIIENFSQICTILRRPQDHLSKFLLRELASPGNMDGQQRLVLVGKIGGERINQKVQAYASEFVICRECKKPDTELRKENRLMFVKCLACGASHSVRAKIQ